MFKSYPLKLWLTTLVIATLLMIIYEALQSFEKEALSFLQLYSL